MTIAKRHIAVQKLLGTFLNFTPHATDTDLFKADMRILCPILLRDSIKECHGASREVRQPGMAQRAEIHRVYTRKTKELASLYPFIFSVENALRHTAAEFYGEVFRTETWWTIIRDAINEGRNETHFRVDGKGMKKIRSTTVTPKFVKSMFYGLSNMTDHQWRTLQGNDVIDEMYSCLSLKTLTTIIEADWELSRDMFVSDAQLGGVLRKSDMTNWFNIVTTARNELFHSNPMGDISKVSRACENILDKLGFHLGDFDERLAETKITRMPHTTLRTDRHMVPPSG
jgi:hypothetical protein